MPRALSHCLSTGFAPVAKSSLVPRFVRRGRNPACPLAEGHLSRHLPTPCPQGAAEHRQRAADSAGSTSCCREGMPVSENMPQNLRPLRASACTGFHVCRRLALTKSCGCAMPISCVARTPWCVPSGPASRSLWHIYPQQDEAHVPKLQAFLAHAPGQRARAELWPGTVSRAPERQ